MIYLDHNSTSPPDPRVVEAMMPYFWDFWGNPSSRWYAQARRARQAVEAARADVAELLCCKPEEVLFTSGGTEANNQAILGTEHRRLLVSPIEHESIRQAARHAASEGMDLQWLCVDDTGRVDLDSLRRELASGPALVSIQWVNNETGVVQPVPEISKMTQSAGCSLHTDAVQAIGRHPVDLRQSDIDLLTLSGHKIHGPKGIGALFVRRGARLRPRALGGGQEGRRRAGTENVPGIVGLGEACRVLIEERQETNRRIRLLRNRLEEGIVAGLADTVIFGGAAERVGNTTMLGWPGVEASTLLSQLGRRDICAASGSACTSEKVEPSHVLRAMGVSERLSASAVRFSLGPGNREEEIDQVIETTRRLVRDLQKRSVE